MNASGCGSDRRAPPIIPSMAPTAALPAADLARGVESVPALLVAIGAPRLRQLGLMVPATPDQPEHRLYALLAREDSDSAHARYNALVQRLVSYERARAAWISSASEE
jgi:hypothetical protein